MMVHTIYYITVQQGQVTDYSSRCNNPPGIRCESASPKFDPNRYTVPGLFAYARRILDGKTSRLMISYDEQFSFPSRIQYDFSAGGGVLTSSLTVIRFEILE